MTEKRFELTMNGNDVAQYEIVDHNQENLTVYNDLGNVYFSSAMKICELLNDLNDENEQLKKILGFLKNDNVNDIVEVLNLQETEIWKVKRENEQLKERLKMNCPEFVWRDLE